MSPASASNTPATGLHAAQTPARIAARSARPRFSASTAPSATLTPSANVTRPLHTSPSAATANHAAPHCALRPYTLTAARSNSAAEASTAATPTVRTPTSAASGGNTRLYPGMSCPPYQRPSHTTKPTSPNRLARYTWPARSGVRGSTTSHAATPTTATKRPHGAPARTLALTLGVDALATYVPIDGTLWEDRPGPGALPHRTPVLTAS